MCMFSNRLVLCYAHTHAIASTPPSTTTTPSYIAIGVGIVGAPVLLALILVIVGVVYCKAKGQKLEYNIIIIICTDFCCVPCPLNPDPQVETKGEGRCGWHMGTSGHPFVGVALELAMYKYIS